MTRILIVEDEEKVRRMYNAMLKNEGFEVFEAPDAIQASYILNRESVDIMLLDIKMPQVYGSVFYDMMQYSRKKVKVIVASVYPVEEQKKIIEGATDYYDKSQGLDLLLEKVRKVERIIKLQRSILVIDDEPKVRKIYRHYLDEHGYRIIDAQDGTVGLDVLRKSSDISLVILDLAMPRKNGLEIYEKIRDEFPGIKILVASIFNRSDQQFLLPNVDEYYDKTEDAAELVRKVEKLIDASSSECPYFIQSKSRILCACYPGSLFCPNLQWRNSYCFDRFRECPDFKIETLLKFDAAKQESSSLAIFD